MTLLLHTTLAVACLILSVVAEPDVVSYTSTQTSITLTGKPFDCTCTEQNRELFTLMRANPGMFPRANITTCSNVPLKGTLLSDLIKTDFCVKKVEKEEEDEFNVGRLFMVLGIVFGSMCVCGILPALCSSCPQGTVNLFGYFARGCKKLPPAEVRDEEAEVPDEEADAKVDTPLSPKEAPPPYETISGPGPSAPPA